LRLDARVRYRARHDSRLPRWPAFLFLAFQYAKAWGWTVLMAAWVLWFAIFMGGIWLAEWCWKPYREAQEQLRHEQTEALKALETRAGKADSP